MTKRAKWAFANPGRAQAFLKENGGALATFDEAMKCAYEDMHQDTKMIREKRRAMRGAKTEAPGRSSVQQAAVTGPAAPPAHHKP